MTFDKKNMGAKPTLYPTSLVLCGTYDAAGRPNLATLAWAGICCGNPPSVQISVQKARYTHGALMEKRAFTVNIPSGVYAEQADFCGIASGRDVDKFAAAKLTPVRGEFVDAPLVKEFPVCMECRVTHVLELGSHDLFVGEILASWVASSCLSDDGSIDALRVDPLGFAPLDGNYYTLGHSAGRAFDIGKIYMKKCDG